MAWRKELTTAQAKSGAMTREELIEAAATAGNGDLVAAHAAHCGRPVPDGQEPCWCAHTPNLGLPADVALAAPVTAQLLMAGPRPAAYMAAACGGCTEKCAARAVFGSVAGGPEFPVDAEVYGVAVTDSGGHEVFQAWCRLVPARGKVFTVSVAPDGTWSWGVCTRAEYAARTVSLTRPVKLKRGRDITVTVEGDSPEELEATAMAAARDFFGPGPDLKVMRDYGVFSVRAIDAGMVTPVHRTWAAEVTVTEMVTAP